MQKFKKHYYGFISTQNGIGQAEIETKKKKIIVLIHSFPTWNRDFQKNSKKIEKIKKHQYGFFSTQNGDGKGRESEKNKFLILIHSNQTWNSELQKNSKKLKNIVTSSFQAKMGRERLRM